MILSIAGLFFSVNEVYAQKRKTAPVRKVTEVRVPPPVASNNSSEALLGEIEGNIYKNKFFGVKINVPENWIIAESEINKAIKQRGAEVVKGKTAPYEKALNESVQRLTISLLNKCRPGCRLEMVKIICG